MVRACGEKHSLEVIADCIAGTHQQDTRAAENVLALLQYDPALTASRLQTCLDIGDKLDDRGKATASAMVDSGMLATWLSGDAFSSPLLVNGHCDLEAAEGQSPLSFVDAQLVRVFERNDNTFVVKYFCGLDEETGSGVASTIKMMASLVGELLDRMLEKKVDVDVSFLTKVDLRSIKNMELDILCSLFRELLLQLPSKTVLLCVLDEISLYETGHLENDTNAIMRRLIRLMTRDAKAVFKLLVTCRGRSLGIHRYFQSEDILDLPADIEADDYALWKVKNL